MCSLKTATFSNDTSKDTNYEQTIDRIYPGPHVGTTPRQTQLALSRTIRSTRECVLLFWQYKSSCLHLSFRISLVRDPTTCLFSSTTLICPASIVPYRSPHSLPPTPQFLSLHSYIPPEAFIVYEDSYENITIFYFSLITTLHFVPLSTKQRLYSTIFRKTEQKFLQLWPRQPLFDSYNCFWSSIIVVRLPIVDPSLFLRRPKTTTVIHHLPFDVPPADSWSTVQIIESFTYPLPLPHHHDAMTPPFPDPAPLVSFPC